MCISRCVLSWEVARDPVHPFAKLPDKRQNVSGRKWDT